MEQLIVIIALVILIFCVVLMVLFKSSKEQTKFQVKAIYEGVNELGQVVMKVLFTFSVGKLSTSNKEMLAHIKWSEGWKPVRYSIKENGAYREDSLLSSDLNESFLTFAIDDTNAVDKNGAGEGYVMFTLDCPSIASKSTVAMIIDIHTNKVAYQLSDSTSWDNEFVVSN
ncbi:hypothetical protein AEA09_07425 [Lysinibacillus contaminans]|uniref:Uncharacterized protein n=1 Tax=Lysinibacillus contaminans TaxID=1293441 RepID=A0ABR5K0H3_9BACI|nr:hypothetical protein [Lysinibacillus contaminans]KOS68403.1 hypothetical protein AEA09_07425 [Lysinibacillus contaminans]